MSREEVLNDPITVTASIDKQGTTNPSDFVWQDQPYTIVAVGRQWETEDGRHILIEIGAGDRFELQLARADLRWRLIRAWRNSALA